MNKRFVAVSTVTGSRIRGCFSKSRRDFSVTRGWQQMINEIR